MQILQILFLTLFCTLLTPTYLSPIQHVAVAMHSYFAYHRSNTAEEVQPYCAITLHNSVSGFGLSLCYVASIIIVAYYFDRRRSFATGISVCGSGVGRYWEFRDQRSQYFCSGTFLFAPFTQWLMDTYGGWREACIILAGIFLNMVVCGMMFKELHFNKKKRIARAGSAKSITSQMPEIEELRLALENGDVSQMIHQDKTEQVLASSLITIPTYIKVCLTTIQKIKGNARFAIILVNL